MPSGTTILRFALCAVIALLQLAVTPAAGAELSAQALVQFQDIIGSKQARTAAEKKLDSNLLFAVRAHALAQTRGVVTVPDFVQSFIDKNVDADQTIFVVIKAPVSRELIAALQSLGAREVSEFPQFETVTARVPIGALLAIAQRSDVRSIGPREEAETQRHVPTSQEREQQMRYLSEAISNVGNVTWQGVTAHRADQAISTGITGTGTKVCVLSDGINSLAGRQATGDLPPTVTVLPAQSGNGDEGTAMLEIVHDMAPGAALGFATAFNGVASFATNIQNLRTVALCDIIVDDVSYFNEGAFQDGPIARAVNTVTASGALYFSSAANSGNLTHATSGTFEGDFVNSGAAVPAPITAFEGSVVALHSFGAAPYTTLTYLSRFVTLKWSDPLEASGNDYDLFVMNSTGTSILGSPGAGVQTGTQDPYEYAVCSSLAAGCTCDSYGCYFPAGARIYIVKYSGSTRALRLDTHRGRISNGTTGSTFGHNAAGSALSVGAVNVTTAGGGSFTGGPSNPVQNFSSDGPRKIFYNPGGTAITPSNILFGTGGGTTLPKVDLAAADCGSTTTPGFATFCGTSAAAPTAAAIAALVKSAKPTATKAQVTAALLGSALDIEAPGADRDSGVGIVMAPAAVTAALSPLTVSKAYLPSSISAGGVSTLKIQVTNPNAVALSGVAFTDSYPSQVQNAATPNAAVAGAGCSASSLAATGGGSSFAVTGATIPAATNCSFTVNVTSNTAGIYGNATSAVTTPIGLNTPGAFATLTVSGSGTLATSVTMDGTEPAMSARLVANGVSSVCAPAKSFPGTVAGTYTYKTTTAYNNGPERCVTVNFNQGTCGSSVLLSAYAGSFNPANLSQNYLGDAGSYQTLPFSFMAPANAAVVLVAASATSGVPAACQFSLTSAKLNTAPASTSGPITHGDASFALGASAFGPSPGADFKGVSATLATDHLSETGWWFRVQGDAREYHFPTPDSQTFSGNRATLAWNDVNARGLFSAQLVWTVQDLDGPGGPAPSGRVTGRMTVKNLSGSPLTLSLFAMANLDLSGTNTSDSATLDVAGRIIASDSLTSDQGLLEAGGASAYLVRPSGATSVGAVLGDAFVNDFDSTGLPFGPGDFTGGGQWKDRVLPVGGRFSIPFTLAVNAAQPFQDVTAASFAMTNIMAIKAAGITAGCGGGNYCASSSVSRQEMAAFLVRAVEGEPPAGYCGTTNPFLDVPYASGMCGPIKRLAELGITTGCGGGNYCPTGLVTREQMGAFLARAFLGM